MNDSKQFCVASVLWRFSLLNVLLFEVTVQNRRWMQAMIKLWRNPAFVKLYSYLAVESHTVSRLAKCKSVRKSYAILPDTPVALTSASKCFQMLPAPPGALQSALRLCKSILRCSWKHLQLWRCIQDATTSAKCILGTGSLQECLRGCGVYTEMRQFQESIRPWEGIPAGLQSNWERRWQAWEHLGAPAISLGSLRITIEQSGKNNVFFGNAAGAPGNHSYYLSFNNF